MENTQENTQTGATVEEVEESTLDTKDEPERVEPEKPVVDWEQRAKDAMEQLEATQKQLTTVLDSVARLVDSGLTFGGPAEPQTRTPREKTPSEKALDTIYQGVK